MHRAGPRVFSAFGSPSLPSTETFYRLSNASKYLTASVETRFE